METPARTHPPDGRGRSPRGFRLPNLARHPNDPDVYASFALRALLDVGVTALAVGIYLLVRAAVGGHTRWAHAIPVIVLFATMSASREWRLKSPRHPNPFVRFWRLMGDAAAGVALLLATEVTLGRLLD